MDKVKVKNAYQVIDDICGDLPYAFEDKYYDALNYISIALVEYRIRHNLSPEQLVEKLSMPPSEISSYESGNQNIDLKTLFELFGKLSIDVDLKINISA